MASVVSTLIFTNSCFRYKWLHQTAHPNGLKDVEYGDYADSMKHVTESLGDEDEDDEDEYMEYRPKQQNGAKEEKTAKGGEHSTSVMDDDDDSGGNGGQGQRSQRRASVDTGKIKHYPCIHLLRLIHIPLGWFLLMVYTLSFKSVLSFVFFFPFMCFSLVEPTYIFATKVKKKVVGVIGNLALIWYTITYLITIYIGSIVLAFMQLEPTSLMKDIGITQLHGKFASMASPENSRPGANFGSPPEVLKVPATVLMLVIFCIVYRYREDMAANRTMFKSSSNYVRIQVLFHIYEKVQGTRLIALILMFVNAVTVPDLVRLPFMIFFCAFTISPLLSQKLWLMPVLWTMLLIIALYFWNFSFIVNTFTNNLNDKLLSQIKYFVRMKEANETEIETTRTETSRISNSSYQSSNVTSNIKFEVDPDQLIVPIIVLCAVVLQYMIYRRKNRLEKNPKKMLLQRQQSGHVTNNRLSANAQNKLNDVSKYFKNTPQWIIRLRPILFFFLIIVKYSVIIVIFFKINVNAVSMIYLIFPIIVLFYSMCVMEPKKIYNAATGKFRLDESEVNDYDVNEYNAQVLKRMVKFYQRISFACAVYSGLVLLVQYTIVSVWLQVNITTIDKPIQESGFFIVNNTTLSGQIQWEGYGENFTVLLLSALIGSIDRQWITHGFDKHNAVDDTGSSPFSTAKSLQSPTLTAHNTEEKLRVENLVKESVPNIDRGRISDTLCYGLFALLQLVSPLILISFLYSTAVLNFSFCSMAYFTIAILRLSSLKAIKYDDPEETLGDVVSRSNKIARTGNINNYSDDYNIDNDKTSCLEGEKRSCCQNGSFGCVRHCCCAIIQNILCRCCRDCCGRCVCRASTLWWEIAMVLSPIFAYSTFILNFSTIKKATENYSQLLIWLGLQSDRVDSKTLIQNHIIILVVCGVHGYINRFWAGQRLFFKKMIHEQKIKDELEKKRQKDMQKDIIASNKRKYRKLMTNNSRQRLKDFTKDGKQLTLNRMNSYDAAVSNEHESVKISTRYSQKRTAQSPANDNNYNSLTLLAEEEVASDAIFIMNDEEETRRKVCCATKSCCQKGNCCWFCQPCCCRPCSLCLSKIYTFIESSSIKVTNEALNFQSTLRLTRVLSYELTAIMFVIAAAMRTDFIGLIYLCMCGIMLVSARKTTYANWGWYKLIIFILSITQYVLHLGLPIHGYWNGYWLQIYHSLSNNYTVSNYTSIDLSLLNATYLNMTSLINRTVLETNGPLLVWFDIKSIESIEATYEFFLIDLILLICTMYQSLVFLKGEEDANEYEHQYDFDGISSYEHAGGILDYNMPNFFDQDDNHLPADMLNRNSMYDQFNDMTTDALFKTIKPWEKEGLPRKGLLFDWWNIVSILRNRKYHVNDPVCPEYASFCEMSTLMIHLEESVKQEEAALKLMRIQLLEEAAFVQRAAQKANKTQEDTVSNTKPDDSSSVGSLSQEVSSPTLKSESMHNILLAGAGHRNVTPPTGVESSSSNTIRIAKNVLLHEEVESNNRWLFKEVQKARALVYIGYPDLTAKHVRRSSESWCTQLFVWFALKYGPKLAATVIVISCLFDFSVFSLISLLLAIRCLLDPGHVHLKTLHRETKRRWILQLGYTLLTLIIRIVYQCPIFEKQYKRSSGLISLGLIKVGTWWTMGDASAKSDIGLLQQQMESPTSHLINLITLSMSILAVRILLSSRYCFITTREKFDSISAINLARATMAKVEFQRDDELQSISDRIHSLEDAVQKLQTHSHDQIRINQEIDAYLFETHDDEETEKIHRGKVGIDYMVFERSGRLHERGGKENDAYDILNDRERLVSGKHDRITMNSNNTSDSRYSSRSSRGMSMDSVGRDSHEYTDNDASSFTTAQYRVPDVPGVIDGLGASDASKVAKIKTKVVEDPSSMLSVSMEGISRASRLGRKWKNKRRPSKLFLPKTMAPPAINTTPSLSSLSEDPTSSSSQGLAGVKEEDEEYNTQKDSQIDQHQRERSESSVYLTGGSEYRTSSLRQRKGGSVKTHNRGSNLSQESQNSSQSVKAGSSRSPESGKTSSTSSGDFGTRFKKVMGDIKKHGTKIGKDINRATQAVGRGVASNVSNVKRNFDDAVEQATTEPVGHLQQGRRSARIESNDHHRHKVTKCEEIMRIIGKILNGKSLHIAMFFMLLDWIVSQSYLTALYPIVIFCYILIQNPLQLPLIQTGKNGIVYEQDRLNYEIINALTRWARRHLESQKQEQALAKEEAEQQRDGKGEKTSEILQVGEAEEEKKRESELLRSLSPKAKKLLGTHDAEGNMDESTNGTTNNAKDTESDAENTEDGDLYLLTKDEVADLRNTIIDILGDTLYDYTEEELKQMVAKPLGFAYDVIDAPISLGFYNRSGLPTVTVARALKVVEDSAMQEEEVKHDVMSQEALSLSNSTEGQIHNFVEYSRRPTVLSLSPSNTGTNDSAAKNTSTPSRRRRNNSIDDGILVSEIALQRKSSYHQNSRNARRFSMLSQHLKRKASTFSPRTLAVDEEADLHHEEELAGVAHHRHNNNRHHHRDYSTQHTQSATLHGSLGSSNSSQNDVSSAEHHTMSLSQIAAKEKRISMELIRKRASQQKRYLDFGRLFETDSKVNCKFYYLDQKGALSRAKKIPATIIRRCPHKILEHKIVKTIMRDLHRVTNEAKQHNALLPDQRKMIVEDLTELLRDCVQRGVTPQHVAKVRAETILRDYGVASWRKNNPNSTLQLQEHYNRAIEPLTKTHEGWCVAYEVKLDQQREQGLTEKEYLTNVFSATTVNISEFSCSYYVTGWNSRDADDHPMTMVDGIDSSTEPSRAVETKESNNRNNKHTHYKTKTEEHLSNTAIPVKQEEDHLRIIVSENNLKRKISRSWVHPLVQLPPEFLWNVLILYGFLIIVLKLSYQVPIACPCYQPWTKKTLTNWTHLSTYSFYPRCNASYSSKIRTTCQWGEPKFSAHSNILPYDHLLGVHKVYSETTISDDATHILEAQSQGYLLNDCILTMISIVAIIIHSSRLKRTKSYDILRFMRNPKIFNDTIGFSTSNATMFARQELVEEADSDHDDHDDHDDTDDDNNYPRSVSSSDAITPNVPSAYEPKIMKKLQKVKDYSREQYDENKDSSRTVSIFNFLSPLISFFKREYFLNIEPEAVLPGSSEFEKERPKPGVDWYRLTVLSQFVIFFYVALFQLNPTRTIAQWQNSTLNVGYVLMLFLISLLMVAERMMYLYRSIVMKTLVHVSWVIFVVVMIHSNVYTDIFRLEGGESLRWFAYIQLPYFFFSSLQISYGYPPFVGGRLVVELEDWYAWALLYLPFRGFPFLFEIKLLLDYFCTQTTFYLQDFVKYEDIRANIYVIGVNLDWSHQESRARGQPRPFCSRCCSGGLCFTIIWVAMFLPLFLFTSSTSSINDDNKIQTISLELSIATFPSFFEMTSNIDTDTVKMYESKDDNNGNCDGHFGQPTGESDIADGEDDSEENVPQFVCLQSDYPNLRNIPYADSKEYENKEVQKLDLSTSSGSNWQITIDSRKNLIKKLNDIHSARNNLKNQTLSFEMNFKMVNNNNQQFVFQDKYVINPAVAKHLEDVLDKSHTRTYVSLPKFMPTFLRLPREGAAFELKQQNTDNWIHRQSCILILGSPFSGQTANVDESLDREEIEDIRGQLNSTENTKNATAADNKEVKEQELLTNLADAVLKQTTFESSLKQRIDNLTSALNDQKQDYWSIQCDKNKAAESIQTSAPQTFSIYAISAQVSIGQLFGAAGIASIYTLLIVYLSSAVRGMFSGGSANTMFYDWPRHDVIKQYVVKIAECRALAGLNDHDLKVFRRGDGNSTNVQNKVTPLEAEEEYFRELVDIYRRPDLLYERTGPYRHYFGVDSQREHKFHNQMRTKKGKVKKE